MKICQVLNAIRLEESVSKFNFSDVDFADDADFSYLLYLMGIFYLRYPQNPYLKIK